MRRPTGPGWINLLSQQLLGKGIELDAVAFTEVLKSEQEIADMINPNLEWDTTKDPSLLFGRLIERDYADMFDAAKFAAFKQRLEALRTPAAQGACCSFTAADVWSRRCAGSMTSNAIST